MSSSLFLGLVFILILLPSGSISGINIKIIFLGLFAAVFVSYLITGGPSITIAELIFLCVTAAFLLTLTLNGVLNQQTSSTQVFFEARDICSTILIAWLGFFLIGRGIIPAEKLIAVVVYAMCAVSVFKLALEAASLSHMDVVGTLQSILPQSAFVTTGIGFDLFRLQLSDDILGPFTLFALLTPTVTGVRIGRLSRVIMPVVLLASGFITFSRYIWMLFAVALAAAIVIERNWKLLAATTLAGIAMAVLFSQFFAVVAYDRFQSTGVEISDAVRSEQSTALFEEFMRRPIWGKGLGAHATGIIRSDAFSYSYEIQWLALLMQVGIVGMIGVVLLLWVSVRDLIAARHPAKPWIALLFLLWLGAGFTNTYMTTSFAGVAFAMFIAIFHRIRYRRVIVAMAPNMLEV
jgi:hypothetical protein